MVAQNFPLKPSQIGQLTLRGTIVISNTESDHFLNEIWVVYHTQVIGLLTTRLFNSTKYWSRRHGFLTMLKIHCFPTWNQKIF